MKQSRSVVNGRRERILEALRQNGNVSVKELAEQLQVSHLTIRRDLQYLEDHKLLERFYGGARSGGAAGIRDEKDKIKFCREKIARYAASLVADGDSIFINTSATALGMVKYITAKNVTVITNNGNIIGEDNPSQATVVLLGGELRYMKGAMVGEFALNNLGRVTAKKSFVGCSGISPDTGMTTELLNEVNINAKMFHRVTGSSYILADHTKLGKKSSFVSCPVSEIANIITDIEAQKHVVEEFREKGIEVFLVD